MSKHAFLLALMLAIPSCVRASDLPTAPSDELLKVYAQLRSLRGSAQWAVTENVVWARDAATFTLRDGHLTLAEPVGGRVLAAYFEGQGAVRIQAPTPTLQHQLARFTGGPALEDDFKQAVFFFTDDSHAQLQKSMNFRDGADADAGTKAFAAAQKKYAENFNRWGTTPVKATCRCETSPRACWPTLPTPPAGAFSWRISRGIATAT